MSSCRCEYVDINEIKKWVLAVGKIALSNQTCTSFAKKKDNSIITETDLRIEEYLIEKIMKRYPMHHILSEESGSIGSQSDITWIIDPIDGTRAYKSGLPIWGISIGVVLRNMPLVGVFSMPAIRQVFYGTPKMAFVNDIAMKKRNRVNMDDELTFIAVPSNAHWNFSISFPRLRSFGSTTAHLAYVTSGIALAALTRNISVWDIASILPMMSYTGIGLIYTSGEAFNLSTLLEGAPSPYPIIAAPNVVLLEVYRRFVSLT